MECPRWWPLPDNEPIGEDRAQEQMRYLRSVAPAAVDQARVHLLTILPDAQISTHAVTTAALAKQSLGVSIGVVSIPVSSGKSTTVGIALTRAGTLAITVQDEGEPAQRWIDLDGS